MTDDDLRDLKERTALVKELTEHPGWEILIDRARITMQQKQLYMIRGKIKDHEEYVAEVAWMNGLSYVIELPARLEQELFDALLEEQEQVESEDDLSAEPA